MVQQKVEEKKKELKIIMETIGRFGEGEGEDITLRITISEDLRNLIRKWAILNEEKEFYFSKKRYKIKNIIYSYLSLDFEFLFSKKLLDEGTEDFEFKTISRLQDVKKGLIENIKIMIENFNKIIKKEEIKININTEKNEIQNRI